MTKLNLAASIADSLEQILTGRETPLSTAELLTFLADTKEERKIIGAILSEGADTTFKRFAVRGEPELSEKGFTRGKLIRRILWCTPKPVCAHCGGKGYFDPAKIGG